MDLDAEALGDLIADLVGNYVDRATAPLAARIAELERQAPAAKLARIKTALEARNAPPAD